MVFKNDQRYRVHIKSEKYTNLLCENFEKKECHRRTKIENDEIIAEQQNF